jgi:C4-dicarboxylate-specific signal transduction histidine kinase
MQERTGDATSGGRPTLGDAMSLRKTAFLLVSEALGLELHSLMNSLSDAELIALLLAHDERIRAHRDLLSRVEALTGQLRNAKSRIIESRRQRIEHICRFSAHAVIYKLATQMATELEAHDCSLDTRLEANKDALHMDPESLRVVLWCLLLNSIEAGSHSIALTTDNPQHSLDDELPLKNPLRIVVEDDGVGVAPADSERIFSPGFTTKEGALGLGLPLATMITRRSGGYISCNRCDPGKGAAFVVMLPGGGADA